MSEKVGQCGVVVVGRVAYDLFRGAPGTSNLEVLQEARRYAKSEGLPFENVRPGSSDGGGRFKVRVYSSSGPTTPPAMPEDG
ncbi:hypothetical protein KKB40_02100 [Patescibacteria group bacterium]|nr:hypothetical protein [Patescibacteria group bacterium]